MFKHHPDLFEEFTQFLPDPNAQGPTALIQPPKAEEIECEPEVKAEEPKSPQNPPKRTRSVTKKPITPSSITPPTTRFTELEPFFRIKFALGPQKWLDFRKIMELFNLEVITISEVLFLARDILYEHHEDYNWFRTFLKNSPANSNNSENLRTSSSSSSSDVALTDLEDSERNGVSYRRRPANYRLKPCSGRTRLCDGVLNDDWISRPTGEEGGNFKSSRKNEYEELLFKCEDDRFEWDLYAQRNKSAIKALEVLWKKLQTMSKQESMKYKIKPMDISSVNRYAIRQTYGTRGAEIERHLLDQPLVVIPIVLGRLKQKDLEWSGIKLQWLAKWRRVYAENYHKSLDYESVAFKLDQKRRLNPPEIIDECKRKFLERKKRSKVINIQEPDYKITFSNPTEYDPNNSSIYHTARFIINLIADKTLGVNEYDKFHKILLPMLDTFFGEEETSFIKFFYQCWIPFLERRRQVLWNGPVNPSPRKCWSPFSLLIIRKLEFSMQIPLSLFCFVIFIYSSLG
uniref:Histone deacetylase interacting domain-containing protein n=1 Tax=Arcella intermedia TaxID=1963864 RepID=A0A6B2L119_9EUKA